MRKHTKRLLTKVAIGTVAIIIVAVPLLIWLTTSPEIAFEGETVSKDKWDEAYEQSPLWEEYRKWCREQQLEKPYCTIKLEDIDFREGLYEHQQYRIRIEKGAEGEVLGRVEHDAKRKILEKTQPQLVERCAITALSTLAMDDVDLQYRIAELATSSDAPAVYLKILANGGSKSADTATALRSLMLSGATPATRIMAAKTLRLILPATSNASALVDAAPDFLSSDQPEIRKLGLDALMLTPGPEAAEILTAHLTKGPKEERTAVLSQLIHLGPKAKASVATLMKSAQEAEWSVEHRRLAAMAIGATMVQNAEIAQQLRAIAIDEDADPSLRLVARNSVFALDLSQNVTWTITAEIKREFTPDGWERMPPPEIIGNLQAKLRFLPEGEMDIFDLKTKKRSKGTWRYNGPIHLSAGAFKIAAPITGYRSLSNNTTVASEGIKIVTKWNATRD